MEDDKDSTTSISRQDVSSFWIKLGGSKSETPITLFLLRLLWASFYLSPLLYRFFWPPCYPSLFPTPCIRSTVVRVLRLERDEWSMVKMTEAIEEWVPSTATRLFESFFRVCLQRVFPLILHLVQLVAFNIQDIYSMATTVLLADRWTFYKYIT